MYRKTNTYWWVVWLNGVLWGRSSPGWSPRMEALSTLREIDCQSVWRLICLWRCFTEGSEVRWSMWTPPKYHTVHKTCRACDVSHWNKPTEYKRSGSWKRILQFFSDFCVKSEIFIRIGLSPAGFLGLTVGPGSSTSSGTEDNRVKKSRIRQEIKKVKKEGSGMIMKQILSVEKTQNMTQI